MYRNAEPEELAGLHPSDRLMVQLIKIERLGPRIEGMLYRRKFDETWTLLDDVRDEMLFYAVLHSRRRRAQESYQRRAMLYSMQNGSRSC